MDGSGNLFPLAVVWGGGGEEMESLNDLRHQIFEYLATRSRIQNKKLTTNWNIPHELDPRCSFGEQQMSTTSPG